MSRLAVKNTIAFINQIEIHTRTVDDNARVSDTVSEYNLKEYLTSIIYEARELIKYNEALIGLENALSNLYEVDYRLNDEIINYAKKALIDFSTYEEWAETSEK